MSRLVGLYPSDWRVRYEGEFLALLEERPPSIRDQFDIARSAIDAHLHPQVNRPKRIRDRYGLGPLAGFGLFALAVFLMATGPVQFDEYGIYRDGSAAFLPLIVAAALLSVGLYRIVDRLPAGARGSRVAGWLAIGAGLGWISIPWLLPLGLVFLLAVLGLAAGARRLGIWPTWSFVVLVAALVVPAGLIAAQLFLPWYVFRVAGLDYVVIFGLLSATWLIVASVLLQGWPDRRPETPRIGQMGRGQDPGG
jgi:hypothetical protein